MNHSEITDYIPQRPPMVMIDSIVEVNPHQSITSLTVTESNIFNHNGYFTESGLVENIAQTAAAGVGYLCKIEQKPVPVGFIASIKDLHIYRLPPVGSQLVTTVENVNEIMGVSIVRGTVTMEDEPVARCEMRIFIKPQ